jgi:hypothetical protein
MSRNLLQAVNHGKTGLKWAGRMSIVCGLSDKEETMRKLALFGLMMIFALSACKKGEEAKTDEGNNAEAPKAAAADPLYGDFDPAAELKAL